MSTQLIEERDSAVLRQTAKLIAVSDIGSPKVTKVIAKMRKALHGEDDGVAIAAPQVGESLRIFVVKGSALALAKRRNGKTTPSDAELKDLIFINPEVVKVSKKRKKMEEGCLSVRWLYGKVLRHEKVSLTALDEQGKKVSIGASGLLAQIFQHEVDHLNGILFTDKAEDVEDLPPTHEEGD